MPLKPEPRKNSRADWEIIWQNPKRSSFGTWRIFPGTKSKIPFETSFSSSQPSAKESLRSPEKISTKIWKTKRVSTTAKMRDSSSTRCLLWDPPRIQTFADLARILTRSWRNRATKESWKFPVVMKFPTKRTCSWNGKTNCWVIMDLQSTSKSIQIQ